MRNDPAPDARFPDSRDGVAAIHGRIAVASLVADWGIFRDCGRWDLLRSLYAPNAVMVTTWFRGDAEEFIRRSKAAFERGARAQHFIGNSSISVNNDRAVADTRMSILLRARIAGIEADVTCVGRFHDRLVRDGAAWRILFRTPVYDKDRIDPVDPDSRIEIDREVLSRFPEGYRYLAYCQSLAGDTLTPGLPTPRSAEETDLCEQSAAWLAGGNMPLS
jgi:hypothetical protein